MYIRDEIKVAISNEEKAELPYI
jgi:hypothetical protein